MSINDIKSSYFIIILFSHLREEVKLKIIKYNKNYQHLLNIKLINYQIFSGKYIEYESNGKEKNMVVMMIILYMKVNISMEKEMEKEKNMINMFMN